MVTLVTVSKMYNVTYTTVFENSYLFPFSTNSFGHLNPSRLKMAKVGARKEKVPPWIMGSLKNKIHITDISDITTYTYSR